MYALSAGRPSHVISIIHENTGRRRKKTRGSNGRARQFAEFTCGEVFLPNLNPIDARRRSILNAPHQGSFAVSGRRNLERPPIGYVAQNEFTERFQNSGAAFLCSARLPAQHAGGQ